MAPSPCLACSLNTSVKYWRTVISISVNATTLIVSHGELSLPGTFTPKSENDVELSLPGTFAPGHTKIRRDDGVTGQTTGHPGAN